MIYVMKHHSFPPQAEKEKENGGQLNKEQNVQVCDATKAK